MEDKKERKGGFFEGAIEVAKFIGFIINAFSDKTLVLLQWAQSHQDETVQSFWKELCDTVNLDYKQTSASDVFEKLRRYGGNSFANVYRGEGVPYEEIAYDVANALKPVFDEKTYRKSDIESCERFILEKMKVSSDDIEEIARSISIIAEDKSIGSTGTQVIKKGVAYTASREVAKAVVSVAAEKAIAETGKGIAKKAAQKAAEEVAKQTLARVLSGLNVALLAWTAVSIAGPAQRVTIPAVTYIALLRKLHTLTKSDL